MVNKCCVPGCKSNYEVAGESNVYVPIVRFPDNDDTKRKWIQKIPRKNLILTKNTRICVRHFEEKYVLRTEMYTDKDGVLQTRNRDRIKLTDDAIPTLFHNCPSYLSEHSAPARQSYSEKKQKSVDAMNEKYDNWMKEDQIINFDTLCDRMHEVVKPPWNIFRDSNTIVLHTFKRSSSIPHRYTIQTSIEISNNLSVQVYVMDNLVPKDDLNWLFQIPLQLQRWSQLENLLNRYKTIDNMDSKEQIIDIDKKVSVAIQSLQNLVENLDKCEQFEQELKRSKFCLEQLRLIFSKRKKYSTELLIWSFMVLNYSTSSYSAIRETGYLVLPNMKYLKQLSSSYMISPDEKAQNDHFVQTIGQKLTTREKYVALEMDEIYVKQSLEYKKGAISGLAENKPGTEAKTIQAFLISSVFGSMKEVVSLHPVENLTGDDLSNLLSKILELLHSCGFQVIAVISDNNRINSKCFSKLASKACEMQLESPKFQCPTFLTFDTVHVFKNIRNNWINLKENTKSFMIPDFDNLNGPPLLAKFADLRDYYERTCSGQLLKPAYKLNYKSLWPTALERQKVSLVCNVFHETTYTALEAHIKKNPSLVSKGTVQFLKTIILWWSIMNIRTKLLGTLTRNDWIQPFSDSEDNRLQFLKYFLTWLRTWKEKYPNHCLTDDTYAALFRCTSVMISFIEYSLTELKIEYVLPGKMQTDDLERRFGAYRQLSGGSYCVSVSQIMEAEMKLRMKSLLGLKSAKYGQISIDSDVFKKTLNTDDFQEEPVNDMSKFESIVSNSFNYLDEQVDESSLLIISGYGSFKVLKKANCKCPHCSNFLCSESCNVTDEYFNILNRSGLTVPSDVVLRLARHTLCIMTVLISSKYENLFLEHGKQKSLLFQLADKGISNDKVLYEKFQTKCDCGCDFEKFYRQLLIIFCNISLNNYVKLRNNAMTKKPGKAAQRKLATLQRKVGRGCERSVKRIGKAATKNSTKKAVKKVRQVNQKNVDKKKSQLKNSSEKENDPPVIPASPKTIDIKTENRPKKRVTLAKRKPLLQKN